MRKPRVVFPYTEAGFGHIMPMNSVADKFEEMYGDKVECVRSKFFTESNDKKLSDLEIYFRKNVELSNRHPIFGKLQTFFMDLAGTKLAMGLTMRSMILGSTKHGIRHMDELKPDLVVSTHFASHYYAVHCKSKPLTVVYFPDILVNPMFRYPSDLILVPSKTGYERLLKLHKKHFNVSNTAKVKFLIRKEAFALTKSKDELREELGIDKDRFTIMLAEGGYGIGKMEKICKIILERDLPVTLIPVCGRNEKLYNKFLQFKSKGSTHFKPIGLANNMFELLGASDIFCGKSGASMCAEPCYMGLPHIITQYATNIEQHNGEYYINVVGNALKIFNPEKVVDKIEEFMGNPSLMQPYIEAAKNHHGEYGAEACAEKIFELLCMRFPQLKE